MTTDHKLPPHGTEYRYRGPSDGSWAGCRCDKCTAAQARGGKIRRLKHMRGQGPLVPGAPIVAHIRDLHASGMSYALIARRAEVSSNTITYLVRGLTKSCKREKAAQILAVKPLDFDATAKRPALGSTRRLQALYAIGHNPETIAAETGQDASAMSHIANGRYELVTAATERAIRNAYIRLRTTPGPSKKAKRRAATLGWHGPLAWDDIDDPNCEPEPAPAYEDAPKYERDPQRAAEILHLHLLNESVAAIAKKVGVSEKYVSDQLPVLLRRRARQLAQQQADLATAA